MQTYSDNMISFIRAMAGDGASSSVIQDALRDSFNFEASQSQIRTYMKGYRADAYKRPEPGSDSKITVERVVEEYRKQYVGLPPVPERLLVTRASEMGFDTPQQAVAVFSDYHYGSKIDPRVTGGIGGYNTAIARERLVRWRDGFLRFTQMLQLAINVPILNVLALGDDIEGNGHMFGSQALQMEESSYFQCMGFADDMSVVLIDLLTRFEHINIYKVFGNHGRIIPRARDSYDPDNLELLAWQIIKEKCEGAAPGRFTFEISTSFFDVIDILGYSFYIRHGDGTKINSTYTGALDTKLAFNSIVGKTINYMVLAHHHTASESESEIEGSVITNGCFVGPSLYALRMARPRANRPSQELFFVHPKYGVTHHHRIHLASVNEIRNLL